MASPSPVEPISRERALSALTKRSNSLGMIASGIPGPLSLTTSSTTGLPFSDAAESEVVTVTPQRLEVLPSALEVIA